MVFQTVKYRQENKKVRIALKKVFGIGSHFANQICDTVGISNQKVNQLTPRHIDKISSILTNSYFFSSELKKIIKNDIYRLQKIRSFRGMKKR
uniref:ribosomal protein S13 n=1 Tax=Tetraselmis marina TaxID=41888 RepID=UPI0021823924|nr:ribosomal protein S13 [Tetraselmis marina]UVF37917.1 ribosomal protein S13 [Tetraselmis marina]